MSHLLAIDSGNTRLKWALHDGIEWREKGVISTGDAAQPERLRDEWAALSINRAIVSNVAGDVVTSSIELALRAFSVIPHVAVSCSEQCGVINRYAKPAQLGSDRWAALIAAYNTTLPVLSVSTPRLVAMAGTALTVDALTDKGEFLGGVILPGPALMRAALNRGTARLPAECGEYEMFPSNTLNAIETGSVEACIGAILRMNVHLSARTGRAPTCVLSGGAGEFLISCLRALSIPLSFNENLVLDGLLVISNEMISLKDR